MHLSDLNGMLTQGHKVLAFQERVPEFEIQEPCERSQGWWLVLVIPAMGWWREVGFWSS